MTLILEGGLFQDREGWSLKLVMQKRLALSANGKINSRLIRSYFCQAKYHNHPNHAKRSTQSSFLSRSSSAPKRPNVNTQQIRDLKGGFCFHDESLN